MKGATLQSLGPRQLETLTLLSMGMSNSDIGRRLLITTKSVENRLNEIYTRLGLFHGEVNVRVLAAKWYISQVCRPAGCPLVDLIPPESYEETCKRLREAKGLA